ncbi:MAG: inorganic phosphate transporter [Planctomycetales bacterium]|nr:inorganic phosphate transporter [Planctomycetales bacterium]
MACSDAAAVDTPSLPGIRIGESSTCQTVYSGKLPGLEAQSVLDSLPVSTTHVTCGSLFGIGVVTGRGQWGTVSGIGAAWLITLPLGMFLGAVAFRLSAMLVG